MDTDDREGRTYRLPTATMPGQSVEMTIDRLTQFEAWCGEHGVSTTGTRIERYRRYLTWRIANESPLDVLDTGIFQDPEQSPIQHGLDRYLYVLREAHELGWIVGGLRSAAVQGIKAKLAIIVSGTDFAALDRNTEARNTQFELRIASYFARAGYEIDLSSRTDIIATTRGTTYHVECKRIASPRQLNRRVKDALEQIKSRLPRSSSTHGHFGLVAADVTKVAFSHNGLTRGVTPDHARDVLQDKLKLIGSELNRSGLAVTAKRVVGLWLQIHIPSLVLTPFIPCTRFSSYFMSNQQLNLRSRIAEQRLWHEVMGVDTTGDDDRPPEPLYARRGVYIPANTVVSWDDELLSQLVAGQPIPILEDDHIVFSIQPPGESEFIDFSFMDLTEVLARMNDQERRAEFASLDSARATVMGRLLINRYPYEGHPPWLDFAEPSLGS